MTGLDMVWKWVSGHWNTDRHGEAFDAHEILDRSRSVPGLTAEFRMWDRQANERTTGFPGVPARSSSEKECTAEMEIWKLRQLF
jgi:hypothetical protein